MESGNKIQKIILSGGRWLIFLAVAGLIIRRNDLYWPPRRLFEIFISNSLMLTFIWFLWTQKWGEFKKAVEKIWAPFLMILGGLIIATFINYLNFGVDLDHEGILNFGRIILVMIIVVLIKFYSFQFPNFSRQLPFAFLINFIFVPIFLINENVLGQWKIVQGRFQGLENFPSNASYLFLIILALVFDKLLKSKRPILILTWFILSVFSMTFIWWAMSRASWLAAIMIFSTIIFLNFKNNFKRMILWIIVASFIIFLGYQLVPRDSQRNASLRIFNPKLNMSFTKHDKVALLGNITVNSFVDNQDQRPRLYAWSHYSKTLLKNPWGLGVSYFYKGLAGKFDDKPIGPHNTILEILVMGGVISLIGFVWLWSLVWRSSKNKPMLLAAFLGLLAASMFDNMIAFKAWWIVIGLALI